MKRYIVKYSHGDRLKPSHLTEISKSERRDGIVIWFWHDGEKGCQSKYKNGLLNGVDRWYICNENEVFQHWKKDNRQGIKIEFK